MKNETVESIKMKLAGVRIADENVELTFDSNCNLEITAIKKRVALSYHGERRVYYWVLKCLQKQAGLDVIKKNPGKDGHMTSASFYIVDRARRFAWFHGNHQINWLHDDKKMQFHV